MKKIFAAASLTAIVAVAITLIGSAASQSPELAVVQSSSVHAFADMGVVEGSTSSLTRFESAVAMELRTSGLEASAPYTVWWVVFNSPEGCSEACGEDDIFNADGSLNLNPDATISILWADGGLTDGDGAAAFSGVLPVGDAPGQIVVGDGLLDAARAEVHLVVRAHGDLDLDRAYEQLHTFEAHPAIGGPCDACFDVQFAVYAPTQVSAGN
jgi:hypothetical protein